MPQLTPYILATLLSATVIFIMGIILLMESVPQEAELRNYRLSRRFLAGAYIVLAGVGLWEVFGGPAYDSRMPVMAFTLIAASFQALLFTFSIITLIKIQVITARKVWSHVVSISSLSVILLVSLFFFPVCVFYTIFFVMLGLYCLQLASYIVLFAKEYGSYRRRTDDFFSGNECRRSVWIRNSFYMAVCVGVAAIASLFVSTQAYIVFTVFYMVFYIYFAIKFIDYINLFHRIKPIIFAPEKEKSGVREMNGEPTSEAIEKWLESKEYLNSDITLETLVLRLNINRSYLSAHINSKEGMSFRQWISTLRIAEARRIMESNPAIPIPELAESVGISTQSSFSRQFRHVTGMTPGEFRKNIR